MTRKRLEPIKIGRRKYSVDRYNIGKNAFKYIFVHYNVGKDRDGSISYSEAPPISIIAHNKNEAIEKMEDVVDFLNRG